MDRNEALRHLLDATYYDQWSWITEGNPRLDFGNELPQIARNKAAFYRECAKIEQELGSESLTKRWHCLSGQLLIIADGVKNQQKQQKTDGEGTGDNPKPTPPHFELGK